MVSENKYCGSQRNPKQFCDHNLLKRVFTLMADRLFPDLTGTMIDSTNERYTHGDLLIT